MPLAGSAFTPRATVPPSAAGFVIPRDRPTTTAAGEQVAYTAGFGTIQRGSTTVAVARDAHGSSEPGPSSRRGPSLRRPRTYVLNVSEHG